MVADKNNKKEKELHQMNIPNTDIPCTSSDDRSSRMCHSSTPHDKNNRSRRRSVNRRSQSHEQQRRRSQSHEQQRRRSRSQDKQHRRSRSQDKQRRRNRSQDKQHRSQIYEKQRRRSRSYDRHRRRSYSRSRSRKSTSSSSSRSPDSGEQASHASGSQGRRKSSKRKDGYIIEKNSYLIKRYSEYKYMQAIEFRKALDRKFKEMQDKELKEEALRRAKIMKERDKVGRKTSTYTSSKIQNVACDTFPGRHASERPAASNPPRLYQPMMMGTSSTDYRNLRPIIPYPAYNQIFFPPPIHQPPPINHPPPMHCPPSVYLPRQVQPPILGTRPPFGLRNNPVCENFSTPALPPPPTLK